MKILIRKLKYWHITSIFFFILTLFSCNKDHVFNKFIHLDSVGWHKDSIASFELPALDSIQKQNVFINIRNTNAFPFNNLYLIAELDYPNGKKKIDTLQYQMAKPTGEWLGTGASSIKESKLWYLENFQFLESGNYNITIRHAMRANGSVKGLLYLEGITDIGIQVETTTEHP